ncbi:hypothetical protein M441DRAFT_73473 [Trichoderma asperellum CBS 433.97]|uniref:Uncharacterized protein n=1 Tax=Trichoderma asperellum (strain ATCC 204424 / CBS 433.97 / NBRC 101777) TaxID=1042311 RepID=A0A2T3YU68_TRIA4|nr:hypothetical protein M441DRAFT_73473 [Trichoderma asperellum CBS 433.97]PTB36105.1 hypothetical protein M441DRAFT_73473 [Trichoderma asperellum CBS 433.97]
MRISQGPLTLAMLAGNVLAAPAQSINSEISHDDVSAKNVGDSVWFVPWRRGENMLMRPRMYPPRMLVAVFGSFPGAVMRREPNRLKTCLPKDIANKGLFNWRHYGDGRFQSVVWKDFDYRKLPGFNNQTEDGSSGSFRRVSSRLGDDQFGIYYVVAGHFSSS